MKKDQYNVLAMLLFNRELKYEIIVSRLLNKQLQGDSHEKN